MPRLPSPQIGAALDGGFPDAYRRALVENVEIHDGAIIAGRASTADNYAVIGWSYRLFPPPVANVVEANRGSAFHSALAMSAEADVDAVLLLARREVIIFKNGAITSVKPSHY